ENNDSSADDKAPLLANMLPLTAMDDGPVFHTLEGYDPKWTALIREGVELAQDYWGTYGPVHVWVVGLEEGDAINPKTRQAFIEEYCTWRTATTYRSMAECHPHANQQFIDVAESGEAQAYLSGVPEATPPKAELIFINVHEWFFEGDPIPDPVLRGIHEYTHVYQLAVGHMPTWMMEGGAVFAESWLPSLDGRRPPEVNMEQIMERVQRTSDPNLTIADMENIDTASEAAAEYYLQLAYDSGAWAIAFIVHQSPTQSVSALRDQFFPLVTELGWETALSQYVGMKDKAEFYDAFDVFMDAPRAEQLKLLSELKP
ncbi:MAG: hypothetical protein P8L37_07500, partial [Phycisphaerales bacterium]|nr:hypothetical protein [Phycisphaerales bacterium]